MKRFHVHVAVEDLASSTRFYSALFGTPPTVEKSDYAKWMLDDPRINFAISKRGSKQGVNHLGFQVDSSDELAALQSQHEAAELSMFNEGNTQCCYAQSTKHWLMDPQGVAWEMYHSMGEIKTYNGEHEAATPATSTSACCSPTDNAGAPSATQTVAAKPPTGQCSTACCAAPVVA